MFISSPTININQVRNERLLSAAARDPALAPRDHESSPQGLGFNELELRYIKSLQSPSWFTPFIGIPHSILHPYRVLKRVYENNGETFSLENPDHKHNFAVAIRYFDSSNDLGELKKDDRILCLQLHEVHHQLELEGKIPPFSKKLDERAVAGLRITHKLAHVLVKGLAAEAIGQLVGIVANDLPLGEDDFHRIFPDDSFASDDIPALLSSGIKLSPSLQQHLTNRYLFTLQQKWKEGQQPFNPNETRTNSQKAPSSLVQPVERFDKVADFVEHLQNPGIEVSPEQAKALEYIVERAEAALPQESLLIQECQQVAEAKEAAKSKKQREKNLKDAIKIGQEVGKAIHTWVQHSLREEKHLESTPQAHREFTACMQALELDAQLNEFYYKARPEIQDLIAKKLIQHQDAALDHRAIITQAYAQDVAEARTALAQCRESFQNLGFHKEGLQALGRTLKKYQEQVDSFYLKRSRALKISKAICNGINIAGQIALSFALPGAGAANMALGNAMKHINIADRVINYLDDRNEAQWNQEQHWHQNQVERILESAHSLHGARQENQAHMMTWLQRRQQQREFLVMHPDQFLSIAYQRYLIEELGESQEGIKEIQSRRQACELSLAKHAEQLAKLERQEQVIEHKLRRTAPLNKKYKSLLAKLTQVRTQKAQSSVGVSRIQIELNLLGDNFISENGMLGALQARMKYIEAQEALPEHQRDDGYQLPLSVKIQSSDQALAELKEKMQKEPIGSQECSDLYKKFHSEQALNAQLKQQQDYKQLKETPLIDAAEAIPRLLVNSLARQKDLGAQKPAESKLLASLLSEEAAAKFKYEIAKASLKAAQKQDVAAEKEQKEARELLEAKKSAILAQLPNKEVEYRKGPQREKARLNLQDFTHPDWEKVISLYSFSPYFAGSKLAEVKKLVQAFMPLEADFITKTQARGKIEEDLKTQFANAEAEEEAYRLAQKKRLNQETEIEQRHQAEDTDKSFQKMLWQMIESMPPKERIDCCKVFLAKLEENTNSPQDRQVAREELMRCNQAMRHAYRQQWDGLDPSERVDLFSAHQAATKERQAVYKDALKSCHQQIQEMEQQENLDQLRLKELKAQEKELISQAEIEASNLSSIILVHNMDQNVLQLRAMRGESADPDMRTLYYQHSEHLNQIGQNQALRHWTDLSYSLELLLGQLSTRWDQQSQHTARHGTQFATQLLNLSAGLSYLYKAGQNLAKDAQAADSLSCDNEASAAENKTTSTSLLATATSMASFFMGMPLATQVNGYYKATLTCMQVFLHLCNVAKSWQAGPKASLQEQFLSFSKEYKKVLEHHQKQIMEQLQGQELALHAIDQKLSKLNEKMQKSIQQLDRSIKISRQELKQGFDRQTRHRQTEFSALHSVEIKRKRDQIDLELALKENLPATLDKLEAFHKQMHATHQNGFDISHLVNEIDIARDPKFFIGWLGLHMEGCNHRLATPPLLISACRHFLEIYDRWGQSAINDSEAVKSTLIHQAKALKFDVEQQLNLLSQQDKQIEQAAKAFNEIQAVAKEKIKAGVQKRQAAMKESLKVAIEASKEQMKALVENPAPFVQRFAITRNIINYLTHPLPPMAEKIDQLLHPKKESFSEFWNRSDLLEKTATVAMGSVFLGAGAIAAPVVALSAGIMATIMLPVAIPVAILGILHPDDFKEENPHPYSPEGRFGAGKVSAKLQNVTLIKADRPLKAGIYRAYPCDSYIDSVSALVTADLKDLLKQKELRLINLTKKEMHKHEEEQCDGIVEPSTKRKWKASSRTMEIDAIAKGSHPLIEAKVKARFTKDLTTSVSFTNRSWVQLVDLPQIANMSSSLQNLEDWQKQGMNIPKDYQDFLAMHSEEVPDLCHSKFSQWLGEYQLIPSLQAGLPIAFPKSIIDMIERILQEELDARHLSGLPSLLPFYDWQYFASLDNYVLELVIKTDQEESVESRRFTLFSLESAQCEALRGLSQKEISGKAFEHQAMLLYAMYCSFWELGMPSDGTYKLASGKVTLSCDQPFDGFYKWMDMQAETLGTVHWQWSEGGEASYHKALKGVVKANKNLLESDAFKKYRQDYYLAMSLAKLLNKVESKAVASLKSNSDSSLQSIFKDNGLPNPETYQIFENIEQSRPQVETLKKELDRLPFSRTAEDLVNFYRSLNAILAKHGECTS